LSGLWIGVGGICPAIIASGSVNYEIDRSRRKCLGQRRAALLTLHLDPRESHYPCDERYSANERPRPHAQSFSGVFTWNSRSRHSHPATVVHARLTQMSTITQVVNCGCSVSCGSVSVFRTHVTDATSLCRPRGQVTTKSSVRYARMRV
jgi:hypothetical protein